MFTNFIYFVIVVLIYTTYQTSGETNFAPLDTLLIFLLLIILFTISTWAPFSRLKKQVPQENLAILDHKFNTILTRQSILAIGLFAINIYALNLTSFFIDIRIFKAIPTLEALLFLGLFISYLATVWACAHGAYRKIYTLELTRRSYIISNISFSIPVLLPWILLSGIADIINNLPFELPKRLLSTPEGEVAYFLFFLLAIAVMGPAIIQKCWGCTPLEPGEMRKRIDGLCRRSGMEYNNILYWPIFGGRMITAGVMGLVKKFRYILVTKALLQVLEPEEIDTVIVHEIGHIKKHHLLFYLVFLGGYMLFSYAVFDLIVYLVIYIEPLYRFINYAGLNQGTVLSILISFFVIMNFVIYFRYIFGYFMRNFERQADTHVYTLFNSANPLISTLEKIAVASGRPADKPNWHHFSIAERIGYLKKCEIDRTWITRHDRKIKKSIALYLAGIVVVGVIGYTLNFGKAGKALNSHFFEKIIQRELQKTPANPNLYSMLGDLYYSRKNFDAAVAAYEKALMLDSENPRVLNNLAWLYATCEDRKFRNSKKAVQYAEKAVAFEDAPHTWDTLAESYYVNGDYKKAVSAAKRALGLAGKNRSYFEKQLEKFMKAGERVRL